MQSEGGQILIFVIIILMLAVLVIPVILGLTYSSGHAIDIRTEKTQALYAADSGIEDAILKLNNLGNATGNGTTPPPYTLPSLLNNSQVAVTIEYRGNGTYGNDTYPTYLITSTTSSRANPTVTVQAYVHVGPNVLNTSQLGPPVVGTSPFDYAVACLSTSGPALEKNVTIAGDVYSNGPIDLPSGSQVVSDGLHPGSVWANGNVILENGVTVSGDVHATGDITLGQTAWIGSSTNGGNAYAGGSIQALGSASKIWDSAEANGAINVKNYSGVAHSVLAGGDVDVSGPVSSWGYNAGDTSSNGSVTVENSGKIIGWVDAHGTVTTKTGGVIVGTKTQGAPEFTVSLPEVPTLVANDVSFWQEYWGNQSKATGNVHTGTLNVGSGNLGPIYVVGDLTVTNHATVQLTGTVYVTGSVTIEQKADIEGPGTIVAEGTITDNPNCTYGPSGEEVLLMSLSNSTEAINAWGSDVQGTQNCVLYAPYGGVSFKNHDTVYGSVIGLYLSQHNGFSATWTEDVYGIPGLPGGYVSQGNQTVIPGEEVWYTGPVIDWYKVQ
jgi:hypothetical protein